MELIKQLDETLVFNTQSVRIIGTYEDPWFVAKDICDILTIKDVSMALIKLPEEWKGSKVIGTLGGKQNMRIINEAGIYRLIMRSNKDIAETFQRWVCSEVLPSIRKKGEYKMNEEYQLKLKNLEDEKLKIEEEKNKLEIDNKKLTKRYVKKVKEVFDDKNVIYIMATEESIKSRQYAIGKTTDLTNRKSDYDHNKLHDFKVIFHMPCSGPRVMDLVESAVLMKLSNYRYKAGRDVFLLPETSDIELFSNVIEDCVKFYQNIAEVDVIYAKATPIKIDSEILKESREKHKEKKAETEKEYYKNNKEAISFVQKIYNEENAEKISDKKKEFYQENREKVIESVMEYYVENKEKILEQRKEYYEDNKEIILDERSKYYEENYKTKIAPQRQAKETCECGMVVTHYCMKRHKTSTRHILLMKNLEKVK